MTKTLSVVGDWFNVPPYAASLAHAVYTHLYFCTSFKEGLHSSAFACPNANFISFGRVTRMSVGNEFVSVRALSDSHNYVKFPRALWDT